MDTLYSALVLIASIGVWFLNSKLICKLIEPIREYPYTKFEKCNPPLGTGNGIGFRLYCGGRTEFSTNSQACIYTFAF